MNRHDDRVKPLFATDPSEKVRNHCLWGISDSVLQLNTRPRKCLGFKTPYEVFEIALMT